MESAPHEPLAFNQNPKDLDAMNPTTRTLIYAAVAVVFAGGAYMTDWAMRPAEVTGFEKVGQEFYPDFTDPTRATALRVAAYDETMGRPVTFTVEKQGDQWIIPSHHDYPAEAKKRLAETATSVMGVVREALASRRSADHERYGVIDPLNEETTSSRGRGRRITLFDQSGETLVDFIIGNQVEGQDGQYFVRRPDEKETYRARLDVQLSTEFSQWIEPDLLKLTSTDIVGLEFHNPIVKETRRGPAISGHETIRVTREDTTSDWQLDDLDEATEQLNDEPIRTTTSTLDNLKIVDVRPKPQGLQADLTLASDFQGNPQELVRDLVSKGFLLAEDPETGERSLYSRDGEILASTQNGVVYHVHFGNRVTGTQKDIEIGGSDEAAQGETGSKASNGGIADSDQPGRYVFVRVEFDESLLGPPPEKPTKPEKPAGSAGDQPDKKKQKAEETPPEGDAADTEGADAEAADAAQSGGDSATEKLQGTSEAQNGSAAKDGQESDPQTEHEAAMKQYEQAMAEYKRKKADYEEKRKNGRTKAKELNERFGNWYYVISAESFEALTVSREDLVEPKGADEESGSEATGKTPQSPVPGGDKKPAEAETPQPDDADESSDSAAGSTPSKAQPSPGDEPSAQTGSAQEKDKTSATGSEGDSPTPAEPSASDDPQSGSRADR